MINTVNPLLQGVQGTPEIFFYMCSTSVGTMISITGWKYMCNLESKIPILYSFYEKKQKQNKTEQNKKKTTTTTKRLEMHVWHKRDDFLTCV